VRPFLPSRNAFLRRIEMLRDATTDPVPAGPLPRSGRWLTVALLAAAALAVAGLRGPDLTPAARAQPPAGADARQTRRKIEELRAQQRALDAKIRELERLTRPGGRGDRGGFAGVLDLSRAPADTVAAVVARPAAVLGRPEFKPVADLLNEQARAGRG